MMRNIPRVLHIDFLPLRRQQLVGVAYLKQKNDKSVVVGNWPKINRSGEINKFFILSGSEDNKFNTKSPLRKNNYFKYC